MAKNLTPIGLEPNKNDSTDGLPESPKESPTKEKNLTPIGEESKKKGSTDGLPVNPQPELYL